MELGLQIAIVLLAFFAFLPIIKHETWWIRIFDFPRIQVAGLTILVFLLYLFEYNYHEWTDNLFGIIVLLILVYLTIRIFPFTPFFCKQVPDAAKKEDKNLLKLMVGNVRQKNRDTHKFLAVAKEEEPDILLAVETDEHWQKGLAELEKSYPYCKLLPQDNTYGMLLFSKLELLNVEVHFMVEDDVPSIHALVKMKNGTPVKLYCLHPRPPEPGNDTDERDAELLLVGKEVKKMDMPVVVFGDMNDVAWSHTTRLFQRISHLLDPRIGRGFYNSYHAQIPFLRWPLDHFFHTDHFKIAELRRIRKVGSDHFPVVITLSYEPNVEGGDVPQPEGDDREEMEEKLSEQN